MRGRYSVGHCSLRQESKSSSHLLTEQRPLWPHVSIFNILTNPQQLITLRQSHVPDKKSAHTHDTTTAKCTLLLVSSPSFLLLYLTCMQFFRKKNFDAFTCSKLSNLENIFKTVRRSRSKMTHDGDCCENFLRGGIFKSSRTFFVSVFTFFFYVNSFCLTFFGGRHLLIPN